MSNDSEQLIILGNGFDLACGAKTSYNDFFRDYFKKNTGEDKKSQYSNSEIDGGKRWFLYSGENFWFKLIWGNSLGLSHRNPKDRLEDIQFYLGSRSSNWSDLENTISVSLKVIDEYYHQRYEYAEVETDSWDKARQLPKEVSDVLAIVNPLSKRKNYNRSKEEFFNKIRRDLSDLEKEFSQYVKNIAIRGETKKYRIKGQKLANYLEKMDRSSDGEIISKYLSFNYTTFFDKSFVESNQFVNIHGRAKDDNVIFGIDDHDLQEKFLQFTKTYRIMDDSGDVTVKLVTKNTKYIKFYGHSLASADYSYFQSIFDTVDLYESDTELVFYYSEYDGGLTKVRENMKQAIAKLIHTYGQTLDNEDHGKNLLHKLLLERRLKIAEINTKELF